MKPTSIIFLIISVLLIITGFAAAGFAHRLAAEEGIEITAPSQSEGYENIFTYDYSEDSIGKISVDVRNARVNIIGGSAKPYVELVNFAEGTYEFTSSNRAVVISNNQNPASLSGLAAIAMNFKGLRSLINYYNTSGLEQTVNIYLCDEIPVNSISCSVKAGDVFINDSSTHTDYSITVEKGNLTAETINTKSTLSADIGTGNIIITDSNISIVEADIKEGNFTTSGSWLINTDVSIDSGDVDYTAYESINTVIQKLFTNIGVITADGIECGGFREYTDPESISNLSHLTVSIGTGDINLKSAVQTSEQ